MGDIKTINGFQDFSLKMFLQKKLKYFFIINIKVCDSTLEKTKYENKGREQNCYC